MKIEKINDNKLKVILTKEDLATHNITPQSLKEQNFENNELFMDILCEAEEEFNISLSGFPLIIEGTANSSGDFIFIITRLKKDCQPLTSNNFNINIKKEKPDLENKYLIYSFANFDDIIDFINNIDIVPKTLHNVLFQYNNMYYLVIKNTKTVKNIIEQLTIIICDFGCSIPYPTIFKDKLDEYGKKCIKDNAINTIKNYKAL